MKRKQLIMDKSLELFAENGFNATSVQEITDHCGISKGAFYLSFKSKDDLISTLVEEFLQSFADGIDRVVRESNEADLLYQFFYYHFEAFAQQSDFAKIFIKEQTHFFNEEFIAKIMDYNTLIQQSILMMLEKLYGEKINDIKFDLAHSIQGLTSAYMQLLHFDHEYLDLESVSRSLAEKTDLLATHTKTPYITEDLHQLMTPSKEEYVSANRIIEVLDETIDILDASIEKDSLILLKEELINPSMQKAIIVGLLENIKQHPNCKWVAYVLRSYFQAKEGLRD